MELSTEGKKSGFFVKYLRGQFRLLTAVPAWRAR